MDWQAPQYDDSFEEEWLHLYLDDSESESSDSSSSDSSGSSSSSDSDDSSSDSDSDTSEDSCGSSSDDDEDDEDLDIDVLCFLDWDDTLFPSYATNMNNLTAHARAILHRVENHTVDVLNAATALGTVIIVTNAGRNWVNRTKNVMPRVCALLNEHNIEVICAREQFAEDLGCLPSSGTATDWKDYVFHKEVRKFLNANGYGEPGPDEFRVLSVGDSWPEFDAARGLVEDIDEDCLRIWKLEEQPDIDTMCRQLKDLARGIGRFVRKDGYQEKHEVIYLSAE